MFKFAYIENLYILIVIPLLIALFIYIAKQHKKRLSLFGDLELLKPLMSEASWGRIRIKYVLMLAAVALIIVALARPQVGSKLKEIKKEGVEIMLAVDISNSMLAEDFKPSRLERTKFAINQLVDKLQSDRVGLVVFAANAYVQLPITSDVVSAKNFVEQVSPNLVSAQGTSLAAALTTAQRSFSSESEGSRVVILISDGENHEQDPISVAKQLAEQGTVIYTVGIGTPEGAPITIDGEMIKDDEGNIVVSKLDETTLKEIALASGGMYIRANNKSLGLDEIIKQIRSMEQKDFNSMEFDEYNEHFYILLLMALLFLVIEFVTLERKNRIFARLTLFNKEGDKRNEIDK